MGIFKKKDGANTGFKNFINKVGGSIPEVLSVGAELATGDIMGAISKTKEILTEKSESDQKAKLALMEFEKFEKEWLLEAFNSEAEDRKDARSLYREDDVAQKILAALFTIAYFSVSYFLLKHFFDDEIKLDDYELGFISTLFGAMSSKVNTIIDFFFGGSVEKK